MMDSQHDEHPAVWAAALEHQTGPSRGMVTWLAGSDVEVSLGANGIVRVADVRPGPARSDALAVFHRTGESYEIKSPAEQPVWVNGLRLTAKNLKSGDMIEFGDDGPLSRYRLYRGDKPVRKQLGGILSDGLVYLKVSRKPMTIRMVNAAVGILRRLTRETTLLFRITIILAIIGLSTLVYQQHRLNILLRHQIESDVSRLDKISGALARAQSDSLKPGDLKSLRQELGYRLSSNAERLAALERRSEASARIVADSMSSVVFLQGSYAFRERSGGRMLRQLLDDDGTPVISPLGQPFLTLDGDGPVAERQFTGTGFAVGDGDLLVTNRHVALPWENDANKDDLNSQGLEPMMVRFIAYVPGRTGPVKVDLLQAGDGVDLAILRASGGGNPLKGMKISNKAPVPGDEVIVMGYPTGLRSMLAQAGDAFLAELQLAKDTDFWSVATRLSDKGLISPLASRGIVGQTSQATIVYDAETTQGGSGGPVLDTNGEVIAVNTAILPEYGGSNLGVPAAQVRQLLNTIENR